MKKDDGQGGAGEAAGGTAAVFLSYASQDTEAAARVCGALRQAGIDVWFDKSDLRGGEVWDQKIRRQIGQCALFIPLVSANTQARLEGYFRLEWRLAEQRAHRMAHSRPFLLPVCIDETQRTAAEVPEAFLAVQWFQLPGGVPTSEFLHRIKGLLSEGAGARVEGEAQGAGPAAVGSLPGVQDEFRDRTIAVLPFEDLSEHRDQAYFADGIAEEILNLLGKVPALRVIGRTSSFQFKNKTHDLRAIGNALGARYVLEGSARQSAGRVRVTVRLIDTATGAQRWSEAYARSTSDLLQVQEDIAASLVSALQLEVAPEVLALLRSPVASGEAYDVCRRGLHALYRFDQAGLEQAITCFRRALELDPNFVTPAESLAITFDLLTEWQFLPPAKGFEDARAAAQLALRVDGKSPFGHAVLGNIYTYYDWDRAAATRELKTAVELAPNSPAVLAFAAKERLVVGDWSEALRLLDRAISLDPLQPPFFVARGLVYQRVDRTADAKADFRRALEISPGYARVHGRIAEVLLVEGDPQAALAELGQESGSVKLKGLALVHHALNGAAASDAALERLQSTVAASAAMAVAEVYAFRGQVDAAFKWLDRAITQREIGVSYIKGNPLLSALTGDPRYEPCLRRANLMGMSAGTCAA